MGRKRDRRTKFQSWEELENYHQQRANQATSYRDRQKELEIVQEIQEYRRNWEGQENKFNWSALSGLK